jgi:hypothetical protein
VTRAVTCKGLWTLPRVLCAWPAPGGQVHGLWGLFPEALFEIPPSGLAVLRPLAGRTAIEAATRCDSVLSLGHPSVASWRRIFRSPRTHGEASFAYELARGIAVILVFESCRSGQLRQAGLPADKGPVDEVLMRFCLPYRKLSMQRPEI